MRKLYKAILKVSRYGITDTTAQGDSRHIQFMNISCLVTMTAIVAFCIYDSIIALPQLWVPIIITLLYLPLFLFCLRLNFKHRYSAARFLFAFSCISLTFIIAAFYFGRDAGEHYLFLLFTGIAFTVNPVSNWKTIATVVAACILCFVYVELFATAGNVLTPFPADKIYAYRIFTLLVTFVSLFIILIFYEIHVSKQEVIIESYTRNLEEVNNSLRQINEEVTMNHDILAKMNSTKDQMFSVIAHDLRSPVGTIMVASEVLSESFRSNDRPTAEVLTECILKASKSTFSLLDDLLMWSKSQIDNIKTSPGYFNLADIIAEQVSFFSEFTAKKNLQIETGKLDLMIYADLNMVSTVFRNLISNAIKFSHPNGRIQLSAVLNTGNVEIAIRDYGVGMSEELLDEVWTRGQIVSHPGTGNERGTGLGLSICRQLVAKNNGSIRVASLPGHGTSFVVTLPGEKDMSVPDGTGLAGS